MSQPEENPCPCDACDEFALGESTFCIMCEHHNCRVNEPNCPPMENSPRWCDECGEETETELVHGKRLCEDCQQVEPARESDYERLTCQWCNDDISFPFIRDDGERIEYPEDLSYTMAKRILRAYCPDCEAERGTQQEREENNQSLDDF